MPPPQILVDGEALHRSRKSIEDIHIQEVHLVTPPSYFSVKTWPWTASANRETRQIPVCKHAGNTVPPP